jgi:hypothetical protein
MRRQVRARRQAHAQLGQLEESRRAPLLELWRGNVGQRGPLVL